MRRELKKIGGRGKIRLSLEDRVGNEGRESRGRVGGRVGGEEEEDGGMEKWRGKGMRREEEQPGRRGGRERMVQQLMLSYNCFN